MHIEFFVEEESAEAFLQGFLPKVLGERTSFRIHVFQGKPDLLGKLPARLKGYKSWVPADWRMVVLVDEDRQNCRELKKELETAASGAGFVTKTAAKHGGRFTVVNRIAVEEIESWYFGDLKALAEAYPGVPATLENKEKYRDPDAIGGGTWEALERILRRTGHYTSGLPKTELARTMAPLMEPDSNRSRSFQHFVTGVKALVK